VVESRDESKQICRSTKHVTGVRILTLGGLKRVWADSERKGGSKKAKRPKHNRVQGVNAKQEMKDEKRGGDEGQLMKRWWRT
jgi:hypothetical protein